MNNLYANLALSRALQGLNLDSDMWWKVHTKESLFEGEELTDINFRRVPQELYDLYPAPSILSLLTTHARTVFGEEYTELENGDREYLGYQYHTHKILDMLQEEATVDEVSEYILLNKK